MKSIAGELAPPEQSGLQHTPESQEGCRSYQCKALAGWGEAWGPPVPAASTPNRAGMEFEVCDPSETLLENKGSWEVDQVWLQAPGRNTNDAKLFFFF